MQRSTPPPPNNSGRKSRVLNDFSRLSRVYSVSLAGFRARWVSLPFAIATLSAVAIFWQPAQAAELIRCPDWQSLMPKTAALRSAAPVGPAGHSMPERSEQSFEVALAANRAKESQSAATKTGTGRSRPTDTQATNRSSSPRASKTESAASQSTGPLDAAGIFRRNTRKSVPRKTKKQTATSQAALCPTHTVVSGDTLSKIAVARLGNAKRWPALAKANTLTSPYTLRIGQILQLPCAPDGQSGHRQSVHRQAGAGSTPTTPASTPVAVKPIPLPVWTARPGEFVSDVITRWAKTAGHTVVRDGVEEWKISVPVKIRGSFKDALDQLITGFEGSGRPLAISVYANKVDTSINR